MAFPARVSTPGPLNVERWDTAPTDPDLSAYVQPAYQPVTLGLALPKLSLSNILAQQQAARAQESQSQPLESYGSTSGQNTNTRSVQGTTGLPNQRGTAKYGLQETMWQKLGAANAAMRAAGLGTFGITDGFRSYDQQVALKKKKPGLAATPGRSLHGLGIAADLRFTSKQAAWMRQNAAKYGLRVPMPSKEPWHIEEG